MVQSWVKTVVAYILEKTVFFFISNQFLLNSIMFWHTKSATTMFSAALTKCQTILTLKHFRLKNILRKVNLSLNWIIHFRLVEWCLFVMITIPGYLVTVTRLHSWKTGRSHATPTYWHSLAAKTPAPQGEQSSDCWWEKSRIRRRPTENHSPHLCQRIIHLAQAVIHNAEGCRGDFFWNIGSWTHVSDRCSILATLKEGRHQRELNVLVNWKRLSSTQVKDSVKISFSVHFQNQKHIKAVTFVLWQVFFLIIFRRGLCRQWLHISNMYNISIYFRYYPQLGSGFWRRGTLWEELAHVSYFWKEQAHCIFL